MKGIVEINGMHLLAPSVDAAAKLSALLSKCHPMVQKWSPEAGRVGYTLAEPEDYESRFNVRMSVVHDAQIQRRIPKARRLAAPAPEPESEKGIR